MDRTAWQIFLAFQVLGFFLGLVAAILPPWNFEVATNALYEGVRLGYVCIAFFIIFLAFFSLFRNIYVYFIKKGKWEHAFHPGPEHLLVVIYAIATPLTYIFGAWALIPAYIVTSLLMSFIILDYIARERRVNREDR